MLNLQILEKVEAGYLQYLPVHFKDESFKWEAIQHFQKHWDIDAHDFATMLDLPRQRPITYWHLAIITPVLCWLRSPGKTRMVSESNSARFLMKHVTCQKGWSVLLPMLTIES